MRPVILSLLALAMIVGPYRAEGQAPARTQKLFTELRNEKTSDAAAVQLLEDAKGNAEARRYLATQLPSLIRTSERGEVWMNAVRLAGDLRIEEAAPVLAPLLTRNDTAGGFITFYRIVNLEVDPPGKSLAQIGDPAIPSIEKVFENGDRNARFRAVYVLRFIGTTKSSEALRRQLNVETDPNIRSVIGSSMK
jgi:HEAT repeat protein